MFIFFHAVVLIFFSQVQQRFATGSVALRSQRIQEFPGGSVNGVLVSKPGICPDIDFNGFATCASECGDDSACGGSMKCCSNRCGRVCQQPDTVGRIKAGVCPSRVSGMSCTRIVRNCENDSQCIGGRKCCSDGCGTVCVDAGDGSDFIAADWITPIRKTSFMANFCVFVRRFFLGSGFTKQEILPLIQYSVLVLEQYRVWSFNALKKNFRRYIILQNTL